MTSSSSNTSICTNTTLSRVQPISSTSANSNNYLNRTQKVAFQAFVGQGAKERKSLKKAIADEILKTTKHLKDSVIWRQFALMHCPGIIRETSLEGGSSFVSAAASLKFLDSCSAAQNGFFFSTDNISEDTLNKLKHSLVDYCEFMAFNPPYTDKATSDIELKKSVNAYLDTIEHHPNLSTTGTYLPLGYRHGIANQGHAIACKIVEQGDEIIVSIFNLGNGSEPHPIVDYTLDQKKTSFSFKPIAIPKKVFFGPLGEKAFSQLIRYLSDAPLKDGEPYDGKDFYDIFFLFLSSPETGRLLDLPCPEEYAADSQISGDCPEAAIRCILNDVMIHEKVPMADRNKLFLNRDFASLMAHYHAFVENPSCHVSARDLLFDAARSFGANIEKLHANKQIKEEEFIGASAVVHEIVRATKKTPHPPKVEKRPSHSLTNFNRHFEEVSDLKNVMTLKNSAEKSSAEAYQYQPLRLEVPKFESMQTLTSNIKVWVAIAKTLPSEMVFDYVSDCVRQLPIPSSRDPKIKEELWNEVPKEKVLEILNLLSNLLKLGLSSETVEKNEKASYAVKNTRFFQQFLTIYSVYSIADKLARLCQEETKLDGFSCPFLPLPFTFKPLGFTSLPLKEDNERFTAIYQYMTGKKYQSDEGYNDKTIFPISPILEVKQFVHHLLSGEYSKETIQGKNHIQYLAQFLSASSNSTETVLTSTYAEKWMSILPPQVRVLYYFSFLSNVLFSAPGSPFPSSLHFSETLDTESPSLHIENPFFNPKPIKKKYGFSHEDSQLSLFGEDRKPRFEAPVRDHRFETSFQTTAMDRDFADLHSNPFKTLDTNQAISYILSEQERIEWKIDEPGFRTLLYDTRKGNLNLWQTLQDFSSIDNHYLLSHKWVQKALDSCFFQHGFLLERLKEEPENVTAAFREFVSNGLRNYGDNPAQAEAILFLIREGICFESYTQKDKTREDVLNLYRKTLQNLLKNPLVEEVNKNEYYHIRADLHALLLFLESISESTAPDGLFVSFFHGRVYGTLAGGSTWLTPYIRRMIRNTSYKYSHLLLDRSVRNDLCNKILQSISINQEILASLPKTGWEGDFPEYACGDFVIDFYNAKIKSKTHPGFLQIFEYPCKDEVYDYFTQRHGKLFWSDSDNRLISLNGKLEYDHNTMQWKEVVTNSAGHDYKSESLNITRTGALDENNQGFMCHMSYLPLVHLKQDNGSLISYDTRTQKPYLLRKVKKNRVIYQRLNEKGEKLPFVLTELSNLRHSDLLYRYTLRYANPNDLLCFIDKSTNKIHELNFYKLKLQFIEDGKGLAWTGNKEFYLVADESALQDQEEKKAYADLRQEINQFDGAFILYSPKAKKWNVLFPNQPFMKIAETGEDFSRDIRPSSTDKSYATEHFSFEFDPVERILKPLKSDSTYANAYLALLFKMQRSYEKAFKYLNKIKTSSFFNDGLLDILCRFTKINDFSHASLAFNLKFSLFMIRNKNLMLEKQFHKQNSHQINKYHQSLLNWALENYKLYLQKNGTTPEKLQLSEGDKKMLLLAFRKAFQQDHLAQDKEGLNWEEKWKKEEPGLHAQYNVYFSAQQANTLLPQPQEISTTPPIFSSVADPNSSDFSDIASSLLIDLILESYKDYHSTMLTPKQKMEFEMPNSAVRVSNKAIGAHFVELYNQAKNCPADALCDFDFTLLSLIKANLTGRSRCSSRAIGDLLFWVRHFPAEFKDLSLAVPPTEEALEKITERVCLIPQTNPERYAKLKNQWKSKITFEIGKPIPLSSLKEKVKNRKIAVAKTAPAPVNLKHSLEETEVKIYRLFNSPYKVKGGVLSLAEIEQEMHFVLRKDSAQTLSFQKNDKSKGRDEAGCIPEVLMKQVILKNNLSYLYKHRPMLNKAEMNELCRLVNEWFHTRVLLKLKEEGKENLYLPYDYQKYPEISHFCLKSGKFPRKSQLDVHIWNMQRLEKGAKVHFQLGAGDGKTDVVTVLLNLGAKRLGLMPVTCVTQSIYPIDKENLSYNLRMVDEDLYYLEVGVHMINQLSALDLEFIYSQLMQYKSEGKALLITRHTYDALALIRDLALKSGHDEVTQKLDETANTAKSLESLASSIDQDEINNITSSNLKEQTPQLLRSILKLLTGYKSLLKVPDELSEMRKEIGLKIRYSINILNFFEQHCLLICDESHQNADAMTRAIFGTGELAEIPEKERKQMLEMTKRVLGNYLKSPTEKEIDSLRTSLAKEYLALIPDLPSSATPEILAFWTDKKAPQPALLKSLSERDETKEIANLISVTSHFLHDLLPDILELNTNIDHARSLYPQRKYEVPAHNELPSTAEYDDKYKTCALTVKGNYERGLYEDDIRFLLLDMLKSSENEKAQGFHPENTPSNLRFKEWLEKTSLKGQSPRKLEDIVFSDEAMIKSLHEALSKDAAVIDYFLTKYAFVGIGAPTEELSCTTTDVFNGFHSVVSFSATPREDLANPRCIKEYYRDLQFEKTVRKKWKEPQNSKILYAESENDFFEQMKKEGKHLEETIFIDPRGFFRSSSAVVAKKWLENNPKLEGVLYHKQGRSTDVDRNEKICLLKRDGSILELRGSDIETALKEHDLDWDKLNLGTFYGPAKTESAHIKQKAGAKACFFAGDGLTSSHAAQAIMRCRGFRDSNQTVTTFISKALARKIFKDALPTIKGFLSWTKANQKAQEEKRIVLNAFQEIHFAIAKEARMAIKKAHATDTSTCMSSVIDLYVKHKNGLVESNPADAFAAFGEHEVMKNTRFVLDAYAKTTYEKFAYETSYEDQTTLKAEIEAIIVDIKKRIKEISTMYGKQTSKEVEQHLQLKIDAHRDQQKVVPRNADPLSLDGIYGSVRIYSPKFLNADRTLANEVFGSKFLSHRLYFASNHLRTAKLRDDTDPSTQFFKPIHYLTVVITPGEVFAQAQSHEILDTNQDDLMACPKVVEDLKHTAFLVAANGKLVQKGKGALTTSPEKIAEIMSSPWYHDLIVDTALLNGKITNPDALMPRIKKTGWKEFETLWTKITQGLPNPERAHTQAFDLLKKRYAEEYGPNSIKN